MKRLLPIVLFLSLTSLKAQDYLGFVNSNYSGITGAQINPANIVNSRMRFDMNLIGLNVNVANNYLGLRRSALDHNGSWKNAIKAHNDTLPGTVGFPNMPPSINENQFQKDQIHDINNGKDKSIFTSVRVTLPSFMFSVNEKLAFGFQMNLRTYVNVDGVGEDLAKLLFTDIGRNPNYNVQDLLKVKLKNDHLSINEMTWMEYGLTAGYVLKSEGEHFLKVGITPKFLQGLASAYMNVKDLQFEFDDKKLSSDSSILAVVKTEVNYGHSSNLEFPTNASTTNPLVDDPTIYYTLGLKPDPNDPTKLKLGGYPKLESFPGFGLDMGVVYEWRPDYKNYKYDMDGKTDLWRRDKNKYKLKIGFSILDIGGIKYKKGKYSNNFKIDIDSIKYRNLKFGTYPVTDFDKMLDSLSTPLKQESTYRMALPTVFCGQIDYQIWKDFYVNLTPYIALQFKNREAKVHDITNISLAPRWDHKWFGVAVPISYNAFYAKSGQPVHIGTMVRLGPLVLGSNNLGTFFGKNDIFGADLYFMLKVPIPYGAPKDKDKDKVSDKLDKCKTIPGVWEFYGCPDRDGDHIPDADDKCPDVPGIKELQGCPDKDGDGITDMEDACPDDKGPQEFQGCPDRDGDKIIDKEDECPDEPGLKEFMGCPDKDGDGTPDKFDACPDVFGPKEYKGCPDKDGDGLLDKEDACVDVPGPKENKGCPWPDTDKDGILDKDDACPTVSGTAQYKGCPPPPPVKAAEMKIIEKAFSSLEFASAKDIIKPKSFPSLNDLAKLLVTHKGDWKLKLSGHTDNEGNADKNMVLSEKRAKAVKAYLVKKGVPADNVITEWFGQTMPIADNATPAGRQKNRRVEMKIIFKEEVPK